MRALAMTGIVTASWISVILSGSAMRATPPSARMSAGTRSSAITAQAPASSAIRAWPASVTSMITPPLSISARPVLSLKVARSVIGRNVRDRRAAKSNGPAFAGPPLARMWLALCALLQLESPDPVPVGGLVAGVDAVGERLDEGHQRGVGAGERRAVGGVVEGDIGVLADLREARIGNC